MTVELLQVSPFTHFFIPGLFHFIVFGGGNLTGTLPSFPDRKGRGFGLGGLLPDWMLLQLYRIDLYHVSLPLLILFGPTGA